MKQLVSRCKKRVQESCNDVYDSIDCSAAWSFCADATAGLFERKQIVLDEVRGLSTDVHRDQSL